MLEKKQDSTNSRRDFQVGGYSFNNNLSRDQGENSLLIGSAPTFSLFYGPFESGYGWFGVGQEPQPITYLYDNWYQTVVSDGVIQKNSKYNLTPGTLSIGTISFYWESPYYINAPQTAYGKFLRNQYTEYHLVSSSVSVSGNSSSFFFTGANRGTLFTIPYCDAKVYRLLANVNGIQRVSGTQSRSFSAYWDIAFGYKNGYYCGDGTLGTLDTQSFSSIGSENYLNYMNRTSFISTGNLNLAVGATPSLRVIVPSPNPSTEGFNIKIEINGTFSMIGSAKLTEVYIGSAQSTFFPT